MQGITISKTHLFKANEFLACFTALRYLNIESSMLYTNKDADIKLNPIVFSYFNSLKILECKLNKNDLNCDTLGILLGIYQT